MPPRENLKHESIFDFIKRENQIQMIIFNNAIDDDDDDDGELNEEFEMFQVTPVNEESELFQLETLTDDESVDLELYQQLVDNLSLEEAVYMFSFEEEEEEEEEGEIEVSMEVVETTSLEETPTTSRNSLPSRIFTTARRRLFSPCSSDDESD